MVQMERALALVDVNKPILFQKVDSKRSSEANPASSDKQHGEG